MNPDSLYVQGRIPQQSAFSFGAQYNPSFTPLNFGTSNTGYMENLQQKQSYSSGLPILQMYESGFLDKKSAVLMSMMGGNAANALQMMITINNMEAYKSEAQKAKIALEKAYRDKAIQEWSRSSTYSDEDYEEDIESEESYDTKVADAEEVVEEENKPEALKKQEKTTADALQLGSLGGPATGAIIGNELYKYAYNKKGYLFEKDLLKYEQKYELGSKAIESTKGVKAYEKFNAFDIKGEKANAIDWLKEVERKNTHFTELNGGKGYTIDELKALKPDELKKFSPEKQAEIKQLLDKMKNAEKVQLTKRENFTPQDQKNLKVLEKRNTAYSNVEKAQKHINELNAKIKDSKGTNKIKLQEELKLAKEESFKANNEFKKASAEFETVAKKQAELNLKTAESLEKGTSDLLKKVNKAKDSNAMKKVVQETLEKAKKAKNKDMIKVCEDLLKKDSKDLLTSCKGIAENAKSFTAEAEVAAKSISKLTKAKGLLGKAALPVAIALEGFDVYNAYQKSTKAGNKQVIKSSAGLLGAIGAGALTAGAIGATVGSIVPVAGNIVGGAVGLVLGCAVGAIGYWLGSKGGEAIADATLGKDDPEPAK